MERFLESIDKATNPDTDKDKEGGESNRIVNLMTDNPDLKFSVEG